MRSIGFALCVVLLIVLAGVVWGLDPLGRIDRADEEPSGAASLAEPEREGSAGSPALKGRHPSTDPLAIGTGGIRGVVRAALTGSPVAGVPVHVLRRDPPYCFPVHIASTVSAEDGTYALAGLDRVHEVLAVLACGGGWISERALDPEIDWAFERSWRAALHDGAWVEHDLRVKAGARIKGVVRRPDGAPAAEAVVRISEWDRADERTHDGFPWSAVAMTTTDASGRFLLDGLPPARGRVVTAALAGHLDIESEPLDLEIGRVAHVTLMFTRARRIEVRVVDACDGRPVPGAHVVTGRCSARTDAAGHARLEIPAGPARLNVTSEAYVTRTVDAEDTMEVTLHPAARVHGRVDGLDGFAAEGVGVRVEAIGTPGYDCFRSRVATDADGSFAVAVPAVGRFLVSMETHVVDGRVYEAAPVEVDADGTEAHLHADLVREDATDAADVPKGWRITLLGPDGQPLAQARLRGGFPWDRWSFHEVRNEVPFTNGVASIEHGWLDVREPRTATGVRAGAVRLGPYAPGGGEATVRLPPARRLAGRIVDPAGQGVPGVEVRAAPVPPEGVPESWNGWLAFGVSDARGRFVVEGLGVDRVDLDVWPWPDYVVPAPVRARVGEQDVTVAVRPTVSARLRVLLPDGAPAPWAEVEIQPVAGETFEIMRDEWFGNVEYRVDERGEVRLRGLDPDGRYAVRVEPPSAPRDLVARVLEDWDPRDTVIRLLQKGGLRGRVVDPKGEPLRGVHVRLRDAVGEEHWDLSGPAGIFSFHRLPPGPVVIGASFTDERIPGGEIFTVRAEAGDEDAVVVLESPRDLTVSVEGGDPGREEELRVVLTRRLDGESEGPVHTCWTDDAEGCRFRGLEPGASYWVRAGPTPSGRTAYDEVDAATRHVTLGLVPGGVVRGRVSLPADCMGAWARIRERGVYTLAEVHPSGTFQLLGVPPGRWTVVVECYGVPEPLSGRASASPGETVEIELGR